MAAVLAAGVVGTATAQELASGRRFVVALAIVALIWVPIIVLAAMVAGAPNWCQRWLVPSVLVAAVAVLAISDLQPWAASARAYERERTAYRSAVEGIEARYLADQHQVLLLSYGTGGLPPRHHLGVPSLLPDPTTAVALSRDERHERLPREPRLRAVLHG